MGNEDEIPGNADAEPEKLNGLKVTTGPIFLHGELDMYIVEAKSLPNMDLATERIRQCCSMLGPPCVPALRRQQPVPACSSGKHSMITTDPYVSVYLAGATVARTRVIPNCENPLWDEQFCIPVAHLVVKVEFHVKDNGVFGAELIGVVEIPVAKIVSGDMINDWFPIIGNFGSPLKPSLELHILIQFRPVSDNPLYKDGVGVRRNYVGVPNTYFPLRKDGDVTLYQDAHVPKGKLPQILLDDGEIYEQGKCWEDICHAILEAHHLIYIIGWSIYHPVRLVREPSRELPSGGELSLGELLQYKSEEGVRVVVLVWDDKTSHDKFLLKMISSLRLGMCHVVVQNGVMQTHDEETKKFFQHFGIHCVLAPRYASTKLSIFKQWVVGTLYTHHQRCVVLDTQASGNNCKITAFIGGLDLCDGRYDTPEHRLYSDLDTIFKNDIHNPTLMVFRSIDSGSVKGFPKSIEEAAKQNLICGKNLKVDKSIHTAYMKAIRSAQHFIYIENQYFLGSSYHWPSYKNAGANNLVPMELALKIASKINANERFCVYIVIPMWPEGVPTSAAVQEILFWQGQTMTMMYKIIAQALEKVGLSHKYHPLDYLNFYCLGKREPLSSSQSSSQAMNQQSENNALASVQKFRRFMIYVHAKGMIVDDEYVIMGSANINQRSLDGSRDTEIAMEAYQPHHTWAGKKRHPRGQVYGYRMSLWAEHLGDLEDSFREPQSIECVKRVNKIAKQNWRAYVDEDQHNPKEMRGHLMQYSIHVSRDGKVGPSAGFEMFPDVGGKILGSPTTLPDALTT
ncbi:hypothetical protein BT93_G0128 [Corymbia citriodora subsp. variegata]|nr:hypothetical protein BT93_G0128 [Corymbia citriodora subsp. variegata]